MGSFPAKRVKKNDNPISPSSDIDLASETWSAYRKSPSIPAPADEAVESEITHEDNDEPRRKEAYRYDSTSGESSSDELAELPLPLQASQHSLTFIEETLVSKMENLSIGEHASALTEGERINLRRWNTSASRTYWARRFEVTTLEQSIRPERQRHDATATQNVTSENTRKLSENVANSKDAIDFEGE